MVIKIFYKNGIYNYTENVVKKDYAIYTNNDFNFVKKTDFVENGKISINDFNSNFCLKKNDKCNRDIKDSLISRKRRKDLNTLNIYIILYKILLFMPKDKSEFYGGAYSKIDLINLIKFIVALIFTRYKVEAVKLLRKMREESFFEIPNPMDDYYFMDVQFKYINLSTHIKIPYIIKLSKKFYDYLNKQNKLNYGLLMNYNKKIINKNEVKGFFQEFGKSYFETAIDMPNFELKPIPTIKMEDTFFMDLLKQEAVEFSNSNNIKLMDTPIICKSQLYNKSDVIQINSNNNFGIVITDLNEYYVIIFDLVIKEFICVNICLINKRTNMDLSNYFSSQIPSVNISNNNFSSKTVFIHCHGHLSVSELLFKIPKDVNIITYSRYGEKLIMEQINRMKVASFKKERLADVLFCGKEPHIYRGTDNLVFWDHTLYFDPTAVYSTGIYSTDKTLTGFLMAEEMDEKIKNIPNRIKGVLKEGQDYWLDSSILKKRMGEKNYLDLKEICKNKMDIGIELSTIMKIIYYGTNGSVSNFALMFCRSLPRELIETLDKEDMGRRMSIGESVEKTKEYYKAPSGLRNFEIINVDRMEKKY